MAGGGGTSIVSINEPTTSIRQGGLVHVEYLYDTDTATSSSKATKSYNGYFMGAYFVPTAAAAGTDVTVRAHGVDLLNGQGTNVGNNLKYWTAAVDIGGTSKHASLGVPFKGPLTIATAGGATSDNGVIHVYIRLAGCG